MAWRKGATDASNEGAKTSLPSGLDSTYFGPSIPVSIKKAVPLMHADVASVERILADSVAYLKENSNDATDREVPLCVHM
jgi:hypothetical protein